MLKLAKDEGYELSDEEIQQISGGWVPRLKCPKCGGTARRTMGVWAVLIAAICCQIPRLRFFRRRWHVAYA
ncbi:MAG: hypothetical protein IKF78_10745 [Atopobiaceae bacterium]|nr:hypothetical protein [Atopobiaceae bacterium]